MYSQMIAGADAATPGQAKNSWLTGTAAWCYYAATQHILGIKPDYKGLIIEPCIPADWPLVKVFRIFRNACYQIEILNPQGLSKGKVKLEIDGVEIEGNLIEYERFNGLHQVKATLLEDSQIHLD